MMRQFQEKYTQLLRSYYLNPEEALLEQAYRLGKELVAARCDIEDIAEMHTLALKQLAQEFPDSSIGDQRGHLPLLEVLVAYGVTLRTQTEWLEEQKNALEREVAERARVEQELRESEAKWRSLVTSAPDVIFTVDREGKILFINRVPAGLTVEEALGTNALDYVTPEHRETVRQYIERVFQTGQPDSYEIAARGPHDVISWYSTLLGPIKDNDDVVSVILITRDITERKRAEEQIRRLLDHQVTVNQISLLLGSTLDLSTICQVAHQEVQKLVDCPNFAIFLYDEARQEISALFIIGDGQPVDTSNLPKVPLEPGTGPQSRAIVTRQPDIVADLLEQLPRIKTHISVPTQDRRQARSVLTVPMIIGERVIGTMQMQSYEVGVYTPSEAQLLSGIANQVALAIQNADLFAKAQQELAERKRAEQALKEYSERLEEMVEERTQELRDAQEQLVRREKLATLGQLAGAMAHELRNPLGAISNAAYYLNLVLEEPEPAVKETLEILNREVRTSEKIISSLLDYARRRPPIRQTVNVNALVLEALARAGVPANIQVTTQLDETLPAVQADPDQLAQVFDNLIRNAVQAMPAGGQLSVISEQLSVNSEQLSVNSEQLSVSNLQSPISNLQSPISISFTDTGVGIPEENLGKLFEPLFTTKAKGIGLGLALCKMLVEGHGGTIEVKSEVGKGSTFTVNLI